tara:strand:- start:589 stop:1056 length:468 start_codon:yes stop_codon:yes gene_type:complete
MKKIGEYTARGAFDAADDAGSVASWKRISLFDGKFDTGYRITRFVVAASEISSSQDVSGKLATEITSTGSTGLGNIWNWDDNREIAWSSTQNFTTSIRESNFELVDPDNLVIEDLFVSLTSNVGPAKVNYYIEMEKYDINESRGALAMVHNRSQA